MTVLSFSFFSVSLSIYYQINSDDKVPDVGAVEASDAFLESERKYTT